MRGSCLDVEKEVRIGPGARKITSSRVLVVPHTHNVLSLSFVEY